MRAVHERNNDRYADALMRRGFKLLAHGTRAGDYVMIRPGQDRIADCEQVNLRMNERERAVLAGLGQNFSAYLT
jgi:hypothetical protein